MRIEMFAKILNQDIDKRSETHEVCILNTTETQYTVSTLDHKYSARLLPSRDTQQRRLPIDRNEFDFKKHDCFSHVTTLV